MIETNSSSGSAPTEAFRVPAIRWQALLARLETVIGILMIAQAAFAGVLRLLPPELRTTLAFLHRIEWGVYVTIILAALSIISGARSGAVLTNRLWLLGWFAWWPRAGRVLRGQPSRRALVVHAVIVVLLVIAVLWVRQNGFIIQPAR